MDGNPLELFAALNQCLPSPRNPISPAQISSVAQHKVLHSIASGCCNASSALAMTAIPSFDPAITALADMSFTRRSHQALPPATQPQGLFLNDQQSRKRCKIESEPPDMESMDYWLQFDDPERSFEIDYSKVYNSEQNNIGLGTHPTPRLGSGLYSATPMPSKEDGLFDNTVIDPTFSDEEEAFESTKFQNQMPDVEPVQASRISSESSVSLPPLLWHSPQQQLAQTAPSGAEALSRQMGTQIRSMYPGGGNNSNLSPDERRRLLEIAMCSVRPAGAFEALGTYDPSFGIGSSAGLPRESDYMLPLHSASLAGSGYSSPDRHKGSKLPAQSSKRQTARLTESGGIRKASGQGEHPKEKIKSAERLAHNDVERKYRTNLKDRIAELREAVPTLHSATDGDSESGTASTQQGAQKISKGTVLTKATEYIHWLEQRNRAIAMEHQHLVRRLQAFEALLDNSPRPHEMVPSYSMALYDPRGFC